MYDRILIRFGELSLKGGNRKRFVNRLVDNIRNRTKKFEKLFFEITHGRVYIILNGEDYKCVCAVLDNIFGLHSYSLVVQSENDIDIIKQKALELVLNKDYKGKTFKVESNRGIKNFPLTSLEISREVGRHVLINTEDLTVDVHNPDFILNVDLQAVGTFLMDKIIYGLGGFPAASSGKGLLLLSGGIDSPVAGFLAQKRGIKLSTIHFESPPYTNELAKDKVIKLASKVANYSNNGEIDLYIVPFTKMQEKLYNELPESYLITLMRRMMLRISEKLARKNNILCLVTGESVGQVASQTIESMHAINDVTNVPIIRPLVTMDKSEIVEISKKIDTYDISIEPYEDCCTVFLPKSPVTSPKVEKCINYENRIDWEELLDLIVDETVCIKINDDMLTTKKDKKFEDLF